MGIDWNDNNLKIPELLTSSDPIERAKGQVLYVLRNDPTNTKTGDELFIEKAHEYITTAVQEALTGRFVGQRITPDVIAHIQRTATDMLCRFIANASVKVSLPTPTDLQLTITY